jgi:hypothetical protein
MRSLMVSKVHSLCSLQLSHTVSFDVRNKASRTRKELIKRTRVSEVDEDTVDGLRRRVADLELIAELATDDVLFHNPTAGSHERGVDAA